MAERGSRWLHADWPLAALLTSFLYSTLIRSCYNVTYSLVALMAKLESVVKYVFIIEFFPSQIDVSETRAFAV